MSTIPDLMRKAGPEAMEKAAKHLCRLRGEDPFEKVRQAGDTCGVYMQTERWRNAKRELEGLSEMLEALFHGIADDRNMGGEQS